LTLTAPASAAHKAGTVTATLSLPDGKVVDSAAPLPINVGRTFLVHLTQPAAPTDVRAGGSFTLTFARAGRSFTKGSARGTGTFGRGRGRSLLRVAAVSLAQGASSSTLTLSGTWARGSSCPAAAGAVRLTLTSDAALSVLRAGYSASRPCGPHRQLLKGAGVATVASG